MASNRIQSQGAPTKSPQHVHQQQSSGFEQLDKSSSNTLKRNPKMELNKADLLKLVSYLEGELQAREIVIATLKSEKVKQLLNLGGYRPASINDPLAALQRDSFAATEPRVDELQIRALADHQMSSLDNLILQQRKTQLRISRVLKEAEERHKKVVQELDEEKRKHEHDTAQGDDITYGLEKERTRLKQELEAERQAKKKLEKDYKKILDLMEEERVRKKHIVLLLLAERKKIITKYIEESKRSEDLAQILTEEKGRVDTMAEGLEEESKKSLQMEAELEKHLAQFDTERQQLKAALSKEENRVKELESELDKAKEEVESLKKQLVEAHQAAILEAGLPRATVPRPSSAAATPPPPPVKPNLLTCHTSPRPTQPTAPAKGSSWTQSGITHSDGTVSPPPTGTPMVSSVAKVVQPTATVSSVPVCGPTTGIARSVSPGQGIRNVAYSAANTSDSRTAVLSRDAASWPQQTPIEQLGVPVPPEKPVTPRIVPSDRSQPQVVQVTPRVSLSASPGTKVFTTTQGGKVTFHVTTNSGSSSGSSIPSNVPQGASIALAAPPAPIIPSPGIQATIIPTPPTQAVALIPPKKVQPLGRGAPPPVPPNKPVVPPKKESVPRVITPLLVSSPTIAPISDSSQSSNDMKKPVPTGGLKFGIALSKEKIRMSERSPQQGVEAGGGEGSSHHGARPEAGGGGRAGRREPQVGECGCGCDICQCGTCPAPSPDEIPPATAHLMPPPAPASHNCSQAADAAALNGSVLLHCEVARPALHETPDLDMLGQELADFQDLLSSMVSGADIASNKPTSAQAANSVDSTAHCVPATFNGNFRENNIVTLGSQSYQDAVSTNATD